MRERNSFSLFTLAGGGEVPHLRSGRGSTQSKIRTGGTPPVSRMGYPPSMTGWVPPSPISKASTCYAAGSVPPAFMQDFLVSTHSLLIYSPHNITRKSSCKTARGIRPVWQGVWTDTKTRVKTLPTPILRMRAVKTLTLTRCKRAKIHRIEYTPTAIFN